VRPTLEREDLGPARDVIHELIIEELAKRRDVNVVGVDIGGATTDVFSVFDGVFNRTVSANLGMSYSVSNVLAEAGIANIQRWVRFALEEADLRDRIGNKHEALSFGELRRVELRDGAHAEANLRPARGVDLGAGPGEVVHRTLRGGISGLVLDGRVDGHSRCPSITRRASPWRRPRAQPSGSIPPIPPGRERTCE
jgi:hypothetical protein